MIARDFVGMHSRKSRAVIDRAYKGTANCQSLRAEEGVTLLTCNFFTPSMTAHNLTSSEILSGIDCPAITTVVVQRSTVKKLSGCNNCYRFVFAIVLSAALICVSSRPTQASSEVPFHVTFETQFESQVEFPIVHV